ncbi:MAG: TonB family protein [Piscinibacter sp.]
MARAAAMRREDDWEGFSPSGAHVAPRPEPTLFAAADTPAANEIEAGKATILLYARRDDLALDAETPALTLPADEPAAEAPAFETGARETGCPIEPRARRITASLLASIFLHVGAAVAALYLGLSEPPASSAADDSVSVEVVAGLPGAAAVQDQASGQQDLTATNASSEQRTVEAPPVETPVEREAEPTPVEGNETPVAQPDPVTTAQQIIDIPPPPPAPETLAIANEPAPPPPVEQVQAPVQEAAVTEERPQTEEPSPVLAAIAQPAPAPVPPVAQPTPPVVQPPPPVAVQRPQTRQPPSRREAPTTRERVRPTRQVAAAPSPERASRREAPAPVRAASAPRGEGTGQRNSQASNGQGATGGAASAAAVASYRAQVLAHLARFKVYPDQARDRGITGRAAISFTLSRGGQVTASSLAGSSGAAILDQATIAMLRRAQPFPPMPAGGPATMSFTAGIRYDLR